MRLTIRHSINAADKWICTVADQELVDELVNTSPVAPADLIGSHLDCWLCLALEDWIDRQAEPDDVVRLSASELEGRTK